MPSLSNSSWIRGVLQPKFKGKENGRHRPALVLSGKAYNKATGLLICCPKSTSIRRAPTEVPVNNLDSTSVVASNLVTTLDWRVHKVKKAATAEVGVFEEVILRVIPLIGAEHLDTIVPSAGRMSF